MSDAADIIYSDDRTRFTFQSPVSELYWEDEEVPEEGMMVFRDTDADKAYLVTFSNYSDGDLTPDTCYELTAVETDVEDEDDDDEDGDGDGDDDGGDDGDGDEEAEEEEPEHQTVK